LAIGNLVTFNRSIVNVARLDAAEEGIDNGSGVIKSPNCGEWVKSLRSAAALARAALFYLIRRSLDLNSSDVRR
jgi:hypothetical protein